MFHPCSPPAATSTPPSCSACLRTCKTAATCSSDSVPGWTTATRAPTSEVCITCFCPPFLSCTQCSAAVDLSVLVLATGSWPLQPPSTNFLVPKELRLAEDMFYKFYQNQHQVSRPDTLSMSISSGSLSLCSLPMFLSCHLLLFVIILSSPCSLLFHSHRVAS
jgi:hypothetical protein